MPTLPWVVAPTIRRQVVTATVDGQECSLEFPVFGALRGKERVYIREHEYQSIVYRESSRLADALVGEGTEEIEAQRMAIRIISTRLGIPVALDATEQRAMLRQAPLIADISCVLQDAHDIQRLRTITAVITHRLAGCSDWSDDDSGNLPTPVQDAVFAFATSEQTADQPERSPDELVEEMVETLGKLAPDPLPPPSTGATSTGDAESSGLMPQSSDPTDSVISVSVTSSTPSSAESAG